MTGPKFCKQRRRKQREMLPIKRKLRNFKKKWKVMLMRLKRTSLRPLVQAAERGLLMR
jgi:hypothetical protein